jgi:hypothetical protein
MTVIELLELRTKLIKSTRTRKPAQILFILFIVCFLANLLLLVFMFPLGSTIIRQALWIFLIELVYFVSTVTGYFLLRSNNLKSRLLISAWITKITDSLMIVFTSLTFFELSLLEAHSSKFLAGLFPQVKQLLILVYCFIAIIFVFSSNSIIKKK